MMMRRKANTTEYPAWKQRKKEQEKRMKERATHQSVPRSPCGHFDRRRLNSLHLAENVLEIRHRRNGLIERLQFGCVQGQPTEKKTENEKKEGAEERKGKGMVMMTRRIERVRIKLHGRDGLIERLQYGCPQRQPTEERDSKEKKEAE